MRLGLLLCLGIMFLVPQGSESRIVSEYQLKHRLKHLLARYDMRTDVRQWILSKVVFEAKRNSHLNTEMLKVCGTRKTASSKQITKATITATTTKSTTTTMANRPFMATKRIKPTTASTTTTATRPTPTIMSKLITLSTANKRRRKWQLDLDEGSGSGSGMIPLEAQIEEEHKRFDEEQMFRDDNIMNGDNNEDGGYDDTQTSTTWSVVYYGIFQLSDSHFCDSGYRWSRNVCNTSCLALLDEDITDDIECLRKSGYWRYMLGDNIPRNC